MKHCYYLLAISLLSFSTVFGQGPDCANAAPFCTDNGAAFPASTSTISEPGPDYGCLLDQPNPAWYYLQIDQSGDIDISLTNSMDEDIDFICWGPFNSLAGVCNNLEGGEIPSGLPFPLPPTISCSESGPYPCGSIVDCSFDIATSEECNIPNAVSGEFYIMLITNYSGVDTDIFADQIGGTGTTDCSIVPPAGCYFDYLSTLSHDCDVDYTFTVSGDFSFVDNPGTGTIVVEVDDGTNVLTQTFNPPFVDGQLYHFDISGVDGNGLTSIVTIYFSDDASCVTDLEVPNLDCGNCVADIGTFTPSAPDEGTPDYVLCYGETLTITPNGDMTPQNEIIDPSQPLPTYDPTVGWLVYSCPPTVAVSPSLVAEPVDDPCLESTSGGLLGIVAYGTLNEVNDLYWTDVAYPGQFTDNIVYFVPITIYSEVDGVYSLFYTGTLPCYEMGTPIAVQYLPEVTTNLVEDCGAGTVTVTLNGGAPELLGTQFTAVPGSLSPATASFANTSANDGGTIVVQGLAAGENYSFDVVSGDGCTETFSGVLDGSGGATITYPQTSYCIDEPNPTPNLVGPAGGAYTASPAGLTINAATGTITLASSTPGNYTVTYTGPGGICPPNGDFDITVNALPVVSAGPDQVICAGQQATLSGSGAQSYTWDNGVTDGVPFAPAATQTYTVTGTSAAGCQNTDQATVTVQTAPGPVFAANVTSGCAPLQVTFTNLSGGVGCVWTFGNGQQGVGCNAVVTTYTAVGCYDVTLVTTDAAGCVASTTLNNYICVTPSPNASFTPVPNILSSMDPTSQMVNTSTNATSYQWNFGDGTPLSSSTNPIHTFPIDEPGSYVVQLVANNASMTCPDTAWATVIVEEEVIFYVPNTFTPDNDEFNQVFKPVFTAGFDPFDFNMLIFNRWGEVVFESNNAEIGWDGTYNGSLVQDGTYTWKIDFKRSANDAHEIAVGHINVEK